MNKRVLIIAVCVWSVFGISSAYVMARYTVTPGRGAENPPPVFPTDPSQISGTPKFKLLLFAHPMCPCTRATLDELATITSQSDTDIEAFAYFYIPAGNSDDFRSSATVEQAQSIAGLNVTFDPDGATARRFDANTSGQVLLYSPAGQLLYAGGITPGRGHSGPNDGRAAILRFVAGRGGAAASQPVFGCAITETVQTFE